MIVLDRLLTAIIYLVLFYVLFFIGKLVHRLLHREYDLSRELVEKDNPAVALALTGYYIGMVFAIGRELDLPILFAATGEQLDDWAEFDPVVFVEGLFAED